MVESTVCKVDSFFPIGCFSSIEIELLSVCFEEDEFHRTEEVKVLVSNWMGLDYYIGSLSLIYKSLLLQWFLISLENYLDTFSPLFLLYRKGNRDS